MALKQKKYADKTRKERFALFALVNQGLDEQEALIQLRPDDSNRSRRLDTWIKYGVWPIPADELEAFGREYLDDDGFQTTSELVVPTSSELVESTSELVQGDSGTGTHESSYTLKTSDTAGPELLACTSQSEETVLDTMSTLVPDTLETNSDQPSDMLEPAASAENTTLVQPTRRAGTETTRPLVDELVDDNADEVKEMMSHLLVLHRRGQLAKLACDLPELITKTPSPMPRLPARPLSVYCNDNLRKMAVAKALKDPDLPARETWNPSSLTSYLLWQYLGCPTKEEIENWSEE